MKAGVANSVMVWIWTLGFIYVALSANLSAFQLVVIGGIAVVVSMVYELIGFVGNLKISFVSKKEDE